MRRRPKAPGPERGRGGRIASAALFWCGAALIGLLALPTAILIGVIGVIWKSTDWLLRLVEQVAGERWNGGTKFVNSQSKFHNI